ncbi:BTAD domain-containing putative transcriptional regulator [Streptomyces sparsus]
MGENDAEHGVRFRILGSFECWDGPERVRVGGSVLCAASVALEERRLTAVEQLLELRLAAGETSELIGELREFIEANPLRETLRGQLMLALFRSGRKAEALEEFTKVREFLGGLALHSPLRPRRLHRPPGGGPPAARVRGEGARHRTAHRRHRRHGRQRQDLPRRARRAAMASLASPVTVVTCCDGTGPHGA